MFAKYYNLVGFTTYPSYIVTSQPTSVCSDSDTSSISQTLLGNSEDDIVFQPNVTEVYSGESRVGDQCNGISFSNEYDLRSIIGQSNFDISLTPSLPTASHDQDNYGNRILFINSKFILE